MMVIDTAKARTVLRHPAAATAPKVTTVSVQYTAQPARCDSGREQHMSLACVRVACLFSGEWRA